MRRLIIGSLPLPKIYVAKDKIEAKECKKLGVPYIIWSSDYRLLVKLVLYPILKELFPYIRWTQELGIRESDQMKRLNVNVPKEQDVLDLDYDEFTDESNHLSYEQVAEYNKIQHDDYSDGLLEDSTIPNDSISTTCGTSVHDRVNMNHQYCKIKLEDCIGDMTPYVNIKELDQLRILPTWLGDISNVIHKNLDDYLWQDGWNKKLRCCIGNHISSSNAPNLIIIDVSRSIPVGIAATMLSLCATLREHANADLIITGDTSGWYPLGCDLPDPQELRSLHGRGNESAMFNAILKEHILGKEWGNVIAFGDDDSPAKIRHWHEGGAYMNRVNEERKMNTSVPTKVHNIYSFHTDYDHIVGYAKWASYVSPDANVIYNTQWVNSMNRR